MLRKFGLVVVVGLLLAAGYFFEVPVRWGLSDQDVADAARRGRQVFLTNCAPCHSGDEGPPSQMSLRQDYSQREIRRALSSPPEDMPPFGGSAAEQRDLLLFLTEG